MTASCVGTAVRCCCLAFHPLPLQGPSTAEVLAAVNNSHVSQTGPALQQRFWKSLSGTCLVDSGLWTLFPTAEEGQLRGKTANNHQHAETGCRWSPRLWAWWVFCGLGKNRTGKGRVGEKLEKQNSFVARHTLNKPELFCHPQTEWEYFFSYLSGIKNSHHSLPMLKLYCLSLKKKKILAQLMIQSTCFCPLHLTY